jgi:hypothetical protein
MEYHNFMTYEYCFIFIINYVGNEIENVNRAEAEWFTDETEQGIPGEDEESPSRPDEQAPRKEDEGIPGEEKPVPAEREIKPEEPKKPEITLDELAKQVETLEETREKRLQERISHLTDTQQQEARKSIKKIESSLDGIKISLSEAVNDLKKAKNWLISERDKQGEFDFGEIKEKPSQVLKNVIIEVPKDFSPGNMERILTPFKMKVQHRQA